MKFTELRFEMNLDTIQINYILGVGRSGTTLLLRELGKSKKVVSNPESLFILDFLYLWEPNKRLNHSELDFFFTTIFKLKTGRFVHLELWKIDKEKLSKEAKANPTIRFIDLIKLVNLNAEYGLNTLNPTMILDKNPPYTRHFNQLRKLDENSKFIGIYRSYLDNIISRNKFKLDAVNHPYFHALIWCQYNELLLEYAKQFPEKLKLMKYEDLASKPLENLQSARDFLNISSELKSKDEIPSLENLLNELSTKEEKNHFLEMQGKVFTKIDTAAIGKSTNPFSARQLNAVHFICAQTNKKLGYESVEFQKPDILQRLFIAWLKLFMSFVDLKHKVYYESNHKVRNLVKFTFKPWTIFRQ